MSRIISAGKSPTIKIDAIDGDQVIAGWDTEDILIKTDEDELTLNQNGDEVTLSATDDVSLRIPEDASLFIHRIGGDAALRGVMGNLEIREIDNDLSIREAGLVTIETIKADFSLRREGDLREERRRRRLDRDVDGNIARLCSR
jgi:hypothetical protein